MLITPRVRDALATELAHQDDAVLIAFDLIELQGEDFRRMPMEQWKRRPAMASGPAGFSNIEIAANIAKLPELCGRRRR